MLGKTVTLTGGSKTHWLANQIFKLCVLTRSDRFTWRANFLTGCVAAVRSSTLASTGNVRFRARASFPSWRQRVRRALSSFCFFFSSSRIARGLPCGLVARNRIRCGESFVRLPAQLMKSLCGDCYMLRSFMYVLVSCLRRSQWGLPCVQMLQFQGKARETRALKRMRTMQSATSDWIFFYIALENPRISVHHSYLRRMRQKTFHM